MKQSFGVKRPGVVPRWVGIVSRGNGGHAVLTVDATDMRSVKRAGTLVKLLTKPGHHLHHLMCCRWPARSCRTQAPSPPASLNCFTGA
jgi:hypothetical protein